MKRILKKIIRTLITAEARIVLRKYKPKIVAVTGSVGKTSTKDAVAAMLSGFAETRKSEKSFNSELGVPLSILGLPNGWMNVTTWLENLSKGLSLICFKNPYPAWLVLEVGADRPGDIKAISFWLRPDAVIVTRFGKPPVHVEFFGSAKELIREKAYLAESLRDDGLLVLNADDTDVLAFKQFKRQCRMATYGLSQTADIQASHYEIFYENSSGHAVPRGVSFRVNHGGNSIPIVIRGSVGHQHMYPVLAALAFGAAEDFNMVSMAERFVSYTPPPGRMRLIEGIKETILIDDSYNSSPVAVFEALTTLDEIKTTGRKIAILGDMLELGRQSAEAHWEAGKQAAKLCQMLVTVGVRARKIADGALDAQMDEKKILQFDGPVEAGKYLQNIIAAGDLLLIKGSQGVRMERLVEEIMAHPEDKEKLLVRQDPEWQKR